MKPIYLCHWTQRFYLIMGTDCEDKENKIVFD